MIQRMIGLAAALLCLAGAARGAAPGAVADGAFPNGETNKTLYVVTWVDDFGSGGDLPREFVAWYHRHAGPLALMLQRDDVRHYDLDALLARYDFTYDYLGHHFQVARWPGSRLALVLNNRVYARYLDFREWVEARLGVDIVRARHILPLLILALATAAWRYGRTRRRRWLAAAALAGCLAAGFLWLRINYVRIDDLHNWAFEHHNRDWCRGFLDKARADFAERGYAFPPVVRHGWNLPPIGMMDVYMDACGVLADASAISGMGTNRYLEQFGYTRRTLVWGAAALPYYASLAGDYTVPWSGDEADRGLLILPLTFPNCTRFSLDADARAKVHALPDGALVATYLHPHDDWSTIRALVTWLNRTYPNVRYVRPDDYTALAMRRQPRPVLIAADGTASWAWMDADALRPIRRTAAVEAVRTRDPAGDETIRFRVRTEAPVPLLRVATPGRTPDGLRLAPAVTEVRAVKGGVELQHVAPGEYVLTLPELKNGSLE
jgi:hypothetical protein